VPDGSVAAFVVGVPELEASITGRFYGRLTRWRATAGPIPQFIFERGQAMPRRWRFGSGSQVCAVRHTSSINSASILVLRKVTIASAGVQTIGSLSLKDVLMTTGTPVRAKKQDISS
jgi:hypothetical protein